MEYPYKDHNYLAGQLTGSLGKTSLHFVSQGNQQHWLRSSTPAYKQPILKGHSAGISNRMDRVSMFKSFEK